MRTSAVAAVVLLTVVVTGMAACAPQGEDPTGIEERDDEETGVAADNTLVERGRYLATVGGCADCHSPKVFTPQQGPHPDASRHLAGHVTAQPLPARPDATLGPNGWGALVSNDFTAWAGPWGTSFAANLTPDTATGLGTWTEAMFIQTLREGRHQGTGRPILPPMPWQNYREMTDDDLGAMWAYLQSIPAVNNVVPEPVAPVEGEGALPQRTPVPSAAPGSTQPR